MVHDAEVVALGESIHASGGFYTVKSRLIRFLVQELGFRAVMLETPWGDAQVTARYVDGGEGSPEHALKGLFRVWRSEEVMDLVRWLRDYNLKHPGDPVHFAGFDIQQPWYDARNLSSFLKAGRSLSGFRLDERTLGLLRRCPCQLRGVPCFRRAGPSVQT
jgi:erythromycin esterase-like protein